MKTKHHLMFSHPVFQWIKTITVALAILVLNLSSPLIFAQPMFLGGSLAPDDIPKYVIPLVLPPVMPNNGQRNNYDIAVRQFQQQILPGGIWKKACNEVLKARGIPKRQRRAQCSYDATTVWSYGSAETPVPSPGSRQHIAPDLTGESSFNYPAFSFETKSGKPVDDCWINELVRINNITGMPYS